VARTNQVEDGRSWEPPLIHFRVIVIQPLGPLQV
jgi:hypothetical protein